MLFNELSAAGILVWKDALEALVTGLQEKGYELVPIAELIYSGNCHMDHEGRQFQD